MPRTRFDRCAAPKRPAPDYPRELILGRMIASEVDVEKMAASMGVSAATLYRRRSQPSAFWTLGELIGACRYLGIEQEDLRSAIRYSV